MKQHRSCAVELSVDHVVAEILFRVAQPDYWFDARFVDDFAQVCERVSADPEIRVALIRADSTDFRLEPPITLDGVQDPACWRIASALAEVPQPVVVAIQGAALNQGLELALAADLRIAEPSTRFGDLRVVNGAFPFDGCTQRLPRLVGPGLAADMLLTGRILTAAEALDAGLVTRLAKSRGVLIEEARELAREIAARGTVASRYVKEAVRSSGDLALPDGMRLEADLSFLLQGTRERAEGLAAFRERRPVRMPGAPLQRSDP